MVFSSSGYSSISADKSLILGDLIHLICHPERPESSEGSRKICVLVRFPRGNELQEPEKGPGSTPIPHSFNHRIHKNVIYVNIFLWKTANLAIKRPISCG
jgi:hypothetical protein